MTFQIYDFAVISGYCDGFEVVVDKDYGIVS